MVHKQSFLKVTVKRNEAPFQITSLTGLTTRALNRCPLEQPTPPSKTVPHLSHVSLETARNKTNSTGSAQNDWSFKKHLFSLLHTSYLLNIESACCSGPPHSGSKHASHASGAGPCTEASGLVSQHSWRDLYPASLHQRCWWQEQGRGALSSPEQELEKIW